MKTLTLSVLGRVSQQHPAGCGRTRQKKMGEWQKKQPAQREVGWVLCLFLQGDSFVCVQQATLCHDASHGRQ